MDFNIEEAVKAKEAAEKKFGVKDFAAAREYAVKAQKVYPELEGITQMLATFEVYVASLVKNNGEIDYYSVLGVNPVADEDTVRKQYRKLALILHPDKNKTVGAEGAFKLVSEAWTMLSDCARRASYDLRRSKKSSTMVKTTKSSVKNPKVNARSKSSNSRNQSNLQTFWTICTTCQVQYEYLREYVDMRLSCKNCKNSFLAVETAKPPENVSVRPFGSWSVSPEKKANGNHGLNGVTYYPAMTYYPASNVVFTGTGVQGFHSGVGHQYPNVTYQWSPFPGTPAGVAGVHTQIPVAPTASTSSSASAVVQPNGKNVKRDGEKIKAAARAAAVVRVEKDHSENDNAVNIIASSGSSVPKISNQNGGVEKKRKADEGTMATRCKERKKTRKLRSDNKMSNGVGNGVKDGKLPSTGEAPAKRVSSRPAFNAVELLVQKARTEIRKKLEEMKSTAATTEKLMVQVKGENPAEKLPRKVDTNQAGGTAELQKNENGAVQSVSIIVPDPDFHDFDKDRTEECFKPKQIWAIYDGEDGMPRLYCLIRQVISVKPFKIRITHLNSKTDSEFGTVNWLDSGFVKTCGHFRTWETEDLELVNMFSHVLQGAKAGRGGCIRIFPKKGEIWAIYRNWSRDWNRTTPDQVRHQYEMVEVLDDYNEDFGICVTPLVKIDGFKTVYQKNPDQKAVRLIPRKEMLRFSHQVPSWLLEGEGCGNLPEGCLELDPAATSLPVELLQAARATASVTEAKTHADDKPELALPDKICELGSSVAPNNGEVV